MRKVVGLVVDQVVVEGLADLLIVVVHGSPKFVDQGKMHLVSSRMVSVYCRSVTNKELAYTDATIQFVYALYKN